MSPLLRRVLPFHACVYQCLARENGAAMTGIEIINPQSAQGGQCLLQLLTVCAATYQNSPTFHSDNRIAAEQFVTKGIVKAEAFRRMARASNYAPIGMVG